MNNDLNQLDKLYHKSLANYSEKASAYAWTRMRWRLLWLNYGKYIYGTIGAISLLTLGYFAGLQFAPDPPLPDQPTMIVEKDNSQSLAETSSIRENEPNQEELSVASPVPVETLEETPQNSSENLTSTSGSENPGTSESVDYKTYEEARFNHPISENNKTTLHGLAVLSAMNEREDDIHLQLASNRELADESGGFQDTKTPIESDLKSKWLSIGFYLGPAYNMFSLKADPTYDDNLNYRKENESNTVSWSAGADLRFNIRNWYIQTGLSYSTYTQGRNYNYTFKALDSLASQFETDTIWGWVFDPPNIGDPIILGYDTTYVPVYNEINEGTNSWRYLEIPLLLGYKFNKGRFAFDIGTGMSYGFFLGASGNVPDLYDENSFDEIEPLVQQRNMFNYILQIGFSYHLTPNWSLNISPYYKQNLHSVFDNNYPINQRFSTLGINFGLRVDL